MVGSETNTM